MKKYLDKSLSAEERAEALVAEMTVEEQASQLKNSAAPVPRLGIPAYDWWNEGLHGLARSGVATMFPQAIGLAATFDTARIGEAGKITGLETRVKYREYAAHGDYTINKGLTLWAPNVNIFRDPRWGRGHETYGEDPFLTAELGKAFVRGIQGDGEIMQAAACAKHFAVHSGPEKGRMEFDAKVSPKDMEETYLPAFEALVREAKVESVMGAYNCVNGEPACAHPVLMDKLKEWGFDGYFTSDCGAIQGFHENHGVTTGPVESAALALTHGCDLNCGCAYTNLLAALKRGLVTEEDIRRACVHLMRTRFRLGMFDGENEYDSVPYSVVCCREHKDVSLACAERSMVLLKNNGILPLSKNIRTLAVIGPNSDSRIVLEGNYCGNVDHYVTFLEGIQKRFDGRVLYAEGCDVFRNCCGKNSWVENNGISEAIIAAENADAVILCIGLDSRLEGENGEMENKGANLDGDKSDLALPAPQRVLIEAIRKTGKPIVMVCAGGSALNVEADSDALLHVWYPGSEGGTALANLLFGDTSPSGKLPLTFYETADKLPDFTDYSMKNRTYRYAENNVLYPFGYGLTYSEVVCRSLSYTDGIASVTVANTGDTDTEEVVQLYIKDYSDLAVPNHSLCGFRRVALRAGEEITVEIPVSERAFTSVDENGVRAVRGSRFTLYAGTHQPDPLSVFLSGTECKAVDIVR